MKPIEEKKLVVQAEGLSVEQAALFEQKQVIEETVDNLFNTFVLEKTEQVERIEERLEGLIANQMVKIQSLQNARPGILSLPSSRQNWSMNVNQAQARLNMLQDRLEDVREIREGMGMNAPKLHELAMRKLRDQEPELIKKFDEVQTAVRVHQLHEKQRQQQKQPSQSFGLKHSLSQGIN